MQRRIETGAETMRPSEPTRVEPPEGSGWQPNSAYGSQLFKEGPDGRLVRFADVVRWLRDERSLPLAVAVERVCAELEGSNPPVVYRLDRTQWAAPENQVSAWFRFATSGDEPDLMAMPPHAAHAWLAARDMRASWLMEPHVLERLVNPPGDSVDYSATRESPFEFSERMDRTGGPKTLAVPFAIAHALWGWGTVVEEAQVSPFPLAAWSALVAYRKANTGSDWGLGNQIAVARTELGRLLHDGASKSNALTAMAKEVGLGSRQAMDKVLSAERKRAPKAVASTSPAVTVVRDGRKVANGTQ